MGRKFYPFGTSAVDALVKKFFERKGINPNDVISYQLNRGVDEIGTITFTMPFDDEPATPASEE